MRALHLLPVFLIWSMASAHAQNPSHPWTFSTSVTGDFIHVFFNGSRQKIAYLGMEDLVLTLSTQKAKLWKGGTLKVHAINTHGYVPSEEMTHDMQVFDNLEAGDHTGFFELAYEQKLGHFFLLIGQHDLNSDFMSTLYCNLYVNSSFAISPILPLNVPASIYPVTAPCVYARYEAGDKWKFRLATYAGDPGNFKDSKYNLNLAIHPREGNLTIGEAEYANLTGFEMAGVFKIGAYYHSGTYYAVNDSSQVKHGDYGMYLLASKRLAPSFNGKGEGLNGFIQAGFAPGDRNILNYFLASGVRARGFAQNRLHDVFGIGVSWIGLSHRYCTAIPDAYYSETAIEFTYKISVNNDYLIQPDFQYLIHPGASRQYRNALAATMRFSISL